MTTRSRLAGDVGWVGAGHAVRTAAYAAVTVVLARGLGPAEFGRLAVFLAVSAAVATLAGAWPFVAVPVLAGRGWALPAALTAAAAVAVGAGAAMFLLVLPWLPAGLSPWMLLVYALGLVALQGLFAVLQTLRRMRDVAIAQGLERLSALVLVSAVLVAAGLTPGRAQAALAASALLVAVAGFAATRQRTALLEPGAARRWREVLGAVGPLGIVTACAFAVAWVDVLVLQLFRPDADVGHYAVSYQVFTAVLQLGSLWTLVMLPRYAQRAERVTLPTGPLRRAGLGWAAGVGVLAVAAAGLTEPVLGGDYAAAAGPLVLLLAGAVPLALYFAGVPVLIAAGRTAALARISVAGAVANAGLDLVLVPPAGIWGPATATLVQNAGVAVAVTALLLGRPGLRILLLTAPLAIALGLLAIDPSAPGLLAAAAAVTVATALAALRGAPA